MKFFFKIIQILINTKFVFYIPSQKKILFFDAETQRPLSLYFNMQDVFILYNRWEEVNFYVIYKMILSRESLNHKNYLKKIISLVNPKLVITIVDNNTFFYRLKSFFNKIYFVSVQDTIHFVTGDTLEILQEKKIYKEYKTDYYFVYSDSYGSEMSKFIKSNYITIGSVRNNLFKISRNYEKKTLCYISRYPGVFAEYSRHKDMQKIKKQFDSWQVELLEFSFKLISNLRNYCLSNDLNLNVLAKEDRDKYSDLEYEFYNHILGKNGWTFHPRKSSYDSYEKIDKYEIIISLTSGLGQEAIARGKKVAFFSHDQCVGSNFGWPLIKEKKGNFFTNSNDEKEINRIMNYLFSLTDEEWKKSIKPYEKKLFFYDKDNSILKKILKDLPY